MQTESVSKWFEEYLDAFAACGRDESDAQALVDYYGVPLLLSTNVECLALVTEDQVVSAIQGQVDGLRAAGYHTSSIVESTVRVLNPTFALYEGVFSRQRRDGSEIGRPTITYIITEQSAGRRISAIAIHG